MINKNIQTPASLLIKVVVVFLFDVFTHLPPEALISCGNVFYGSANGAQQAYDVTQGTSYPHDPTWAHYRSSQTVICGQKWLRMAKKNHKISKFEAKFLSHI